MIIVLAPGDQNVVDAARAHSENFPHIYGQTYLVGQDEIPMLAHEENVYFTGHGIAQGTSGNAEIGEANGAFALDGLELWRNFSHIFPDMYVGDVYVDACESADFAGDDMFSLIETFKSQSDLVLDDTEVYGRPGHAGFDIPPPGDDSWTSASDVGV